MDFSDFERSREFLLAQQAQFAADLQRSRELSDQRHAEISRALMGLTAIAGNLVQANAEQIEADRRLNISIDNVHKWLGDRIDEVDKRLGQRIDEVDQRLGKRIDELAATLEKYFRDRGNGERTH